MPMQSKQVQIQTYADSDRCRFRQMQIQTDADSDRCRQAATDLVERSKQRYKKRADNRQQQTEQIQAAVDRCRQTEQ
ncbi:hypothetical protein Tco_1251723 [Tanacetum coccineum]